MIDLVPLLHPGEKCRIWKRRSMPRYDTAPRRLPELNILICTSGNIRYFHNDGLYVLGTASILIAQPGDSHFLVSESSDADLIVLAIDPAILDEPPTHPPAQLDEAGQRKEAPRKVSLDALEEIVGLSDTLIGMQKDAALYIGIRWLTHRIYNHWKNGVHAAVNPMHGNVAHALRAIQDDPSQSIDVIASQIGLSSSQLGKYFQKEMGMTMARYRTEKRIERAAHIARMAPYKSLLTIALDVGFDDYSAFYRACQRITGKPPKAFLRASDQFSSPSRGYE